MSDPFVLVVEPDASLSRAMVRALSSASRVAAVSTKRDAWELIMSRSRCVGIVVEASLSDGSAIGWLAEMRGVARDVPLLVIFSTCERAIINEAHRISARCLCKPFARDDLQPFTDAVLAFRTQRPRSSPSKIRDAVHDIAKAHALTASETAILIGAINGLSREEFVEARRITVNTYKYEARGLLRKLHANTVGEVRDRLLRRFALAGPIVARLPGRAIEGLLPPES